MSNFFSVLRLLFLARKGFWDDKKLIKSYNLPILIAPYLSGTIIILSLSSLPIVQFMKRYNAIFDFSLWQIVVFLLYFISGTAPIYEDYGYFNAKTEKTLKIFFKTSIPKQYLVNVVKNIIIGSPIIALDLVMQVNIAAVVFIFICLISFPVLYFCHNNFQIYLNGIKSKSLKLNLPQVIFLRIPLNILIKPLIAFIFSIILIFGISFFKSSLLIFNSPMTSIITGVVMSAMSFSFPLWGYYFLAVFREYDYFLAITKKTIATTLLRYVLLDLAFIIPVSLIMFIFLLLSQFSLLSIVNFFIGWILNTINLISIQYVKGLKLQKKHLLSINLINNYRFSLSDQWPLYLNSLILFSYYLFRFKLPQIVLSILMFLVLYSAVSFFSIKLYKNKLLKN